MSHIKVSKYCKSNQTKIKLQNYKIIKYASPFPGGWLDDSLVPDCGLWTSPGDGHTTTACTLDLSTLYTPLPGQTSTTHHHTPVRTVDQVFLPVKLILSFYKGYRWCKYQTSRSRGDPVSKTD